MTTPMPTPNIPDEVVEAALEAMRSEEFRVFGGYKTPLNGARKEAMRAALQAALPLLLEQAEIWAAPMGSGTKAMYFNYDPTHLEKREPL